MSVTGRKMFKRDARDKVRQMGGIMASSAPLIQEVARFQYGGGVNFGALEQRFTGTPGIKRLRSEVDGPGVKTIFSKQDPMYSVKKPMPGLFGQTFKTEVDSDPLSIARYPGQTFKSDERFDVNTQELVARQNLSRIIGKAKSLGILEKPTVSKSEVEDFIRSETGDPTFEASKTLLEKLSGPSMTRYGVIGKEILKYGLLPSVAMFDMAKATHEFLKQTPDSTVEGILAGEIPMPEGVDIIALGANSGLSDERLQELGVPIDQINAMKKVRAEGLGPLERKVTIKDDISSSLKKAELGQSPGAMGGKLAAELGQSPGAMGGKLAEDQGEPSKTPDPNRREKPESFPETGTLGVTADQGTEAKHANASKKAVESGDLSGVKQEVENTIKSGVGTGGALKQLMKEFTDNAPEYKGMDKGLAIAKIGFAMAAGESPNAITNIAKALSQGADMFIEDNAKRDAFNRQVKLSALQYGLGEVSKQRAQARADVRSRNEYVVGKDGVTIEGEFFEEGRTVTLNEAQVQQLGGKMKNMATLDSINEMKETALKLLEAKMGDPAKYTDAAAEKKIFIENLEKAEDASIAISVLDQVKRMISDPELGLFTRGAKGALGRLYVQGRTFFGMDVDEVYNSQEAVKAKVLTTLSDVISVTIGSTQSANSISDRDVLYQVLEPYFSSIIKNVGTAEAPRFQVVLDDQKLVENQMDAAITKLMKSQGQALSAASNSRNILFMMPNVKGITGGGKDMLSGLEGRASVFGLNETDYTKVDPSQNPITTFDVVENDDGSLDLKRFGG